MCQFMDSILVVTNCDRSRQAALVETTRTLLKTAWGLCNCISPQQATCTAQCSGPVRKAVCLVMTLFPPGMDALSTNLQIVNLIRLSA